MSELRGRKMGPPVSSWLRSSKKRDYDILLASGALVVSAPVIALAALTVLVKDRQNPLFRQERLGQDGKVFSIYKLRTLKGAQEHDGIGQGPQDQRATVFGRFLRKYAIDELPQLINVLEGDMSIVGPRPITLAERERMKQVLAPEEFASWEASYTAGRPGLVSEYAVTTRFMPPDDRDTPNYYRNRAILDEAYAQNASPHVDAELCGSVFATARTLGARALGL